MSSLFPSSSNPSGPSFEFERIGLIDAQGAFGVRADGTTDDFTALQAAIDYQQQYGGAIQLPRGVINTSRVLVCAKALNNADKTCFIRGAGMHQTTIKATFHPTFAGIFGYGRDGFNPQLAPVVMSDLTLDGNYSGVAGGALAATSGDALVSMTHPFTSASAPVSAPTGDYHYFQRVRFYRPTGYAYQGCKGVHLTGCMFDGCGQPDLASGATHYDNLGSDWADAIVIGCTWKDSSGNYVDFQAGAVASRLMMIGNRSKNHQIGGIFGAGVNSVIAFNNFETTNASGIGYDAGTSNKSKNIVAFNNVPNMNVLASGLAEANGDVVYGNVALDQGTAAQTVASAASVTLPPGEDLVKISGTANITSVTAGRPGRTVTLVFTGTAGGTGLTNGSNLRIGANFVYTPDDAITLVCDGTNWFRVAAGAAN